MPNPSSPRLRIFSTDGVYEQSRPEAPGFFITVSGQVLPDQDHRMLRDYLGRNPMIAELIPSLKPDAGRLSSLRSTAPAERTQRAKAETGSASPDSNASDAANLQGLRTDAAADSADRLQRQLVEASSPDARNIAQTVVDDLKTRLRGTAPGPAGYQSIATEIETEAQTDRDGQKAATLRGAAMILRGAGQELDNQEKAALEAVQRGGMHDAGLGARDQTGLEAVTPDAIQRLMIDRVAERARSGLLSDDAKDPKVLRDALHISEDDLKRLQPADRARLAEELKGKLLAYGITADIVPGIAHAIFGLAL
jgi:hypothetical protein